MQKAIRFMIIACLVGLLGACAPRTSDPASPTSSPAASLIPSPTAILPTEPEGAETEVPPVEVYPTLTQSAPTPSITRVGQLGRGVLETMAVSPDGDMLVLVSTTGVWVHRISDGELLHSHLGDATISYANLDQAQIEWSPDGELLAVSHQNFGVWIWDVASWVLVAEWVQPPETGSDPAGFAWSQDSQQLALKTGPKKVSLWNRAKDEWISMDVPITSDFGPHALYWTEQGDLLAWDGRLIDLTAGQIIKQAVGPFFDGRGSANLSPGRAHICGRVPDSSSLFSMLTNEYVGSCGRKFAWSPDGKYLAAYIERYEDRVEVTDLQTNVVSQSITLPDAGLALTWSPENDLIVAAYVEGDLVVHNVFNDQVLMAISLYDDYQLFESDGRPYISTRNGSKLRRWEMNPANPVYEVLLPKGSTYHRYHRYLAKDHEVIIDPQGGLHYWDLSRIERELFLPGPFSGELQQIVNIPEIGWMAVGTELDEVTSSFAIWDLGSGNMVLDLSEYPSVHNVRLSMDQERLLILSFGTPQAVFLFPDLVESGPPPASPISEDSLNAIFPAPSGERYLGFDIWTAQVVLGDVYSSQLLHFDLKTNVGWPVAWSADSGLVAVSTGRSISVIDVQSGRRIHDIQTEVSITALSFSPDNRFLLTGNWHGHLYLLEWTTDNIHHLGGLHPQAIEAIVWDPNTGIIYTGGRDGTVRSWQLDWSE